MDVIGYYAREDVQEAIISNASNREVVARFGEGFGKRPDVLKYPNDVLELAKQGATSFHVSEELWSNPLALSPEMRRQELDELRIGWDLVLDIDCKILDYSKIAADLIIRELKRHGVEDVSIKFSGNKGFHIGVPFEAFPSKIGEKETRLLFPDAPRKIAFYLTERIKKPLGDSIIEKDGFSKVLEKTGKTAEQLRGLSEDITSDTYILAELFLNIDTILISPRHLYRMPYSLHEGSGLASIPIEIENILDFNKERAIPENIIVSKNVFLDRDNVKEGEAKRLLIEALDFGAKKESAREKKDYKEFVPGEALSEAVFPDCIKKILLGLEDGRKRAAFILINFLSSVGWGYDDIEKRLVEWNKLNKPPLVENYVVGQLRYAKQQKKKVLPPNCDNAMYYKDIGVKCSEEICSRYRNPVRKALRNSTRFK